MRTYGKDLVTSADRRNGSSGCPSCLLCSAAGGILGSVVIHGEVHGGNECHRSVMTCLEKQEDKDSYCLLSVYTAEC